MAAILLAVATVDVPLHGPIGDRTVHPTNVQALHDTYRQAIGNLELDLSDIDLPAGRDEGDGERRDRAATVRVPDDAFVVATASVTAGDTSAVRHRTRTAGMSTGP